MSNYLSGEEVNTIIELAIRTDLVSPELRNNILLANIHRGYVRSLPLLNDPASQTQSDLNHLNNRTYLEGEDGIEIPLKTWLDNAINILRSQGIGDERKMLERVRDKVAAASQVVLANLKGELPITAAPPQLERIVHQDDLLSYGWLNGAFATGRSIVRLKITRHENGKPVYRPGSPRPLQYFGTGWLIGRQYVMTNHHVVNARSESEKNANEADLQKQAETAEILFDFDTEEAKGELASGVESLSAWSPYNTTPTLDYAILKLKEPSTREPLRIAPSAVGRVGQDILPVNIVQHPGGNAKSLGIRNNLVSSLGEYDLLYFTDTMGGSSGSPVCDDNWVVIALHRGSRIVNENLNFQGKSTAWVNQGVRIDRIVEDLQRRYPDLWTALGTIVI